ncbi:MAG: NUDIX hydrolase [Thiolinea sp.]
MDDLRCGERLLQHARANLQRFTVQQHEDHGLKRAAVAITIVDVDEPPCLPEGSLNFKPSQIGDGAIILTRRAPKMRKHAGQWALPGGRMDAGETPEQTALRELSEEVGLSLGEEHILGRLDDYSTRSGFTISPVVVWAGCGTHLVANPDEVASIHRIPLAEWLREDAPILESIPESEHPVLKMPLGDNWVAAPTAAMIYQFREVALLGNVERRVAHYEQPYFAWK